MVHLGLALHKGFSQILVLTVGRVFWDPLGERGLLLGGGWQE